MISGARIIALVAVLCLLGCGKDQNAEYQTNTPQYKGDAPQDRVGSPNNKAGAPPTAAAPPQVADTAGTAPSGKDEGASPQEPKPVARQIIRSGQITLRVSSLDSAEAALARIAMASGGYISNSSRTRETGNTLSGTSELRFPASKFDSVVGRVRALGEPLGESINSADVTQEYIDLDARLKTQQELEARLLKLLNDRTGKLADVIEVEEKLAEVRNEIESVQGRLRYLRNQVSLSTLTVNMVEPGAAGTSQTETFGGRIARAFDRGIDGLIDTLGAFIIIVIALLPVIAILALLYFFLLRPWRRRRSERNAKAETTNPTSKG